MKKTQKLTYAGIFISLSFIGSLIKIQNTIAFDSMPAFLGAIMISPIIGGIIGFLGHILTAATTGFYLSIPMHLAIAIEMMIFTYIFGKIYKKDKVLASITLIILNSFVSAFIASTISVFLGLPISGMKLFYIVIVPLFLGSLANTMIAILIYEGFLKNGNKKI